jgi:hypothetical protein
MLLVVSACASQTDAASSSCNHAERTQVEENGVLLEPTHTEATAQRTAAVAGEVVRLSLSASYDPEPGVDDEFTVVAIADIIAPTLPGTARMQTIREHITIDDTRRDREEYTVSIDPIQSDDVQRVLVEVQRYILPYGIADYQLSGGLTLRVFEDRIEGVLALDADGSIPGMPQRSALRIQHCFQTELPPR